MRKFFLLVLALTMATATFAQTQSQSNASDEGFSVSRYEISGGVAITSQNQLVHSHGFLLGYQLGVSRNFGKYFGLSASGASMSASTSSANSSESGYSPTYSQVLIGPDLHANLYERLSGNVHLLFGGSHTGGTGTSGSPSVAFSDDFGAALDYRLNHRFSLRLSGDHVRTAQVTGSTSAGDSSHPYGNVQSSLSLVYHF